jgi:ribosomal protein S18 acetylase RimI-like enzyme
MPYVPKDPEIPEGEEEDLSKELYLMVLVVHCQYKGNGFGERLIRMACAEARALGKEWLRVDCFGGVEKGGVLKNDLVKYYQRNGFTPVRPFTMWMEHRQFSWPGMLMEMKV